MNNLKSFYTNRLQQYTRELQQERHRSYVVALLRFLVFILLVSALYMYHQSAGQILLVFLIWIPFFLFLVSKSADISQKINKLNELIDLNKTELKVLDGQYEFLPDGADFINPKHDYSYDLDLFGKGSFFQYINRSNKKNAQHFLAKLLTENQIGNIYEKQEAVKDLALRIDWRQNFLGISRLVKNSLEPEKIVHVFKYHSYFTKPLYFYGGLVFGLVSIAMLTGYYFDVVSLKILTYWVIAGLTIAGIFAKKSHRFSQELDLVMPSLSGYVKLLQLIENEGFKSKLLLSKKQELQQSGHKAFEQINDLMRIYQQKEMTHNLIVKIIGNSLFLSDLMFNYRLEKRLKQYTDYLPVWLKTVDFFESYISLGNFVFNHPDYSFPKIVKNDWQIQSRSLGHPLISASKRVSNDFKIKHHQFFIITGANMAGKSTFLRTVGLSIVMANIGLPVCAETYEYQPIKLLTSMRTDDSLQEETSYFFSELKRLKYIVTQIQKDDYFVILDEILKGTNSKDKAEGSQKFVECLTRSKATGIIATHDLSLCNLADIYPQVKNHYFDAKIINDELSFDYRFKKGIVQNMNATFLLKKMEII